MLYVVVFASNLVLSFRAGDFVCTKYKFKVRRVKHLEIDREKRTYFERPGPKLFYFKYVISYTLFVGRGTELYNITLALRSP